MGRHFSKIIVEVVIPHSVARDGPRCIICNLMACTMNLAGNTVAICLQ